ncbi:MAG TPA: VOC family protein [Thermoplasmata archaeon]|nr:VOC family protein [Thermoplasmata archaeon]
MHLDYTGLRVTNLPRALAFAERGLGLRELRRGKVPGAGTWVLMEDPVSHQRIELNHYPKASKFATPFAAGEALDHLGVRVSSIAAAGRRLRQAGALRRHTVRWRGTVVVEFWEGPDGLWVELILDPAL